MTEEHTLIIDTKTFDAAQYLPVEFGKCHNLHGHTYTIKDMIVSTEGIVDFTKLKTIIDAFDHCVLTTKSDLPKLQKIAEFMTKENICIFNLKLVPIPYEMATCEYLAQYLQSQLMSVCGVKEVHFRLYETPTQGVKV